MQMWLYGTQSGSHWPSQLLTTSNNQTKRKSDIQLEPVNAGMEAHAAECVAFADAIVNEKPSPVPAEQSRDVQLILNGLYESADKGGEVRLG